MSIFKYAQHKEKFQAIPVNFSLNVWEFKMKNDGQL